MISFKVIFSLAMVALVSCQHSLYEDQIELGPRNNRREYNFESNRGRAHVGYGNNNLRLNVQGRRGDVDINVNGVEDVLDSVRSSDTLDAARKRLESAGKIVGHFYQAIGNFSSEIRDRLRSQGLNDQEIANIVGNFGKKLRQLALNGSSVKNILNEIENFAKQYDLEDIQNNYANVIREQIRVSTRNTGLDKFGKKLEETLQKNGGIRKTINEAEEEFNKNGGVEGIAGQIGDIAIQEGSEGVEREINQRLSEWGLDGVFKNLANSVRGAVRGALRLYMGATPLGQALRLGGLALNGNLNLESLLNGFASPDLLNTGLGVVRSFAGPLLGGSLGGRLGGSVVDESIRSLNGGLRRSLNAGTLGGLNGGSFLGGLSSQARNLGASGSARLGVNPHVNVGGNGLGARADIELSENGAAGGLGGLSGGLGGLTGGLGGLSGGLGGLTGGLGLGGRIGMLGPLRPLADVPLGLAQGVLHQLNGIPGVGIGENVVRNVRHIF